MCALWRLKPVLDDRGRVTSPLSLSSPTVKGDPVLMNTLGRLLEVRNGGGFNRKVTWSNAPPLVFGALIPVWMGIAGRWLPMVPPIALALGVGLVVGPIFRVWYKRIEQLKADSTIETLLRIGRCGSCGYSLEATPTGEDGCQQCSECGSSWRADRIRMVPVSASDFVVARSIGEKTGLLSWLKSRLYRMPSIEDERGRAVALVDVFSPNVQAPYDAENLFNLRQIVRGSARWSRIGWMTCFLGVLAICFVPLMLKGFLLSLVNILVCVFILVQGSYFTWTLLTNRSLVLSSRIKEGLLDHSICPACATNLVEQPLCQDGTTFCHTCGCSWKIVK